jgi:hypothetical protein
MSNDPRQVHEQAEMNAADSQSGEFINPPDIQGQVGSQAGELIPPSLGGDTLAPASQAAVRSAKEQIEQMLVQAASANASTLATERHIDSPGVLGVGLASAIPGQESLVVYVESSGGEEKVRRELVDTMKVQAASDDNFPLEVIVTGPIDAFTTNRSKFRPVPGGVSISHPMVTAGTLGGWARGNGSRANRGLLVSNNHVIANSNNAQFGDAILQPGRADGGQNPGDRIAILERFVKIAFGGPPNFVDCATGWYWPDLVRRDLNHVYHGSSPTAKFFKVGAGTVAPQVNMIVGKTGRTTDLTQGRIQATGVSVNVNYGPSGVAHFRDQFSVQSVTSGTFSAGGDSGSFVWQWVGGLPVVGLLFAGGGGITFCNPIQRVVAALDITLM